MFLQHNWNGRVLHDSYVKPVLESLRYLWKNDVFLATKDKKNVEKVYMCRTEDAVIQVENRMDFDKF